MKDFTKQLTDAVAKEFGKAEVGITCPSCNHPFKKTLSQIKASSAILCPRCKTTIKLDKKGFDTRLIK